MEQDQRCQGDVVVGGDGGGGRGRGGGRGGGGGGGGGGGSGGSEGWSGGRSEDNSEAAASFPPRWPALVEEHLSRLYKNDGGGCTRYDTYALSWFESKMSADGTLAP